MLNFDSEHVHLVRKLPDLGFVRKGAVEVQEGRRSRGAREGDQVRLGDLLGRRSDVRVEYNDGQPQRRGGLQEHPAQLASTCAESQPRSSSLPRCPGSPRAPSRRSQPNGGSAQDAFPTARPGSALARCAYQGLQ